MSLVSKPTALTQQVREKKATNKRGDELANAFLLHLNTINADSYFPIKQVAELRLKEMQHEIGKLGKYPDYPKNLPRFSPSSADKCDRELFYKAVRAEKDAKPSYPFQNRWTRNSTAVHEAVQTTLLDAEVRLKDPAFTVERMPNGLPAWERNIEKWKVFTHHGVQFVLYGMMDGVLQYKDGSRIGFEFKTKSNSVAQIKATKEPQQSHVMQCVAYSLLFDVNEFLITYESVAKDKWSTNENARDDVKVFYVKVTEKQRQDLLNKFVRVAINLQDGEVSEPNYSKCLFCPFKSKCEDDGL